VGDGDNERKRAANLRVRVWFVIEEW